MKLVILIALILITGQSVNSKKIAECDCICEDTAFYDQKSNLFTDIITLNGGDADKCKTYCKTHHKDTATYFAWVDDTFEDEQGNPAKDFHNSCWCKKETDVDGKERTGVTTGKIDCEPIDCAWDNWSKWSVCADNCRACANNCEPYSGEYDGQLESTISRTRVEATSAEHGGKPCVGNSTEQEDCPCPINCKWDEWKCGKCSKSCGDGTRKCNRGYFGALDGEYYGRACVGDLEEDRPCNDTSTCTYKLAIGDDFGDTDDCTPIKKKEECEDAALSLVASGYKYADGYPEWTQCLNFSIPHEHDPSCSVIENWNSDWDLYGTTVIPPYCSMRGGSIFFNKTADSTKSYNMYMYICRVK